MSGLVRAENLFRASRRARRRRASWPLLVAATAVTLVGGVVWAALYSPMLRLTTVTVRGTSRLSIDNVIAAARAPVGRSLIAVSPGAVQARVQRLPAVAAVRVTRQWPHGLMITVVERIPVAAVGTPNGVVLVDAGGVPFASAPTLPLHLLDLRVGGAIPGPGVAAARAGMAVWTRLPAALRRQVTWVDAASADAVSFGLARGATVVWGSPADRVDKLALLATLLRQRAHVYDVSTPSIAVTR